MSADHLVLRVIMLGLRGFPNVQGGVETHAEHLCPHLKKLGCDVKVIVRSSYMPPSRGDEWHGVRYQRVWCPKASGLETIVHSFLGVLVAAWQRPDILHIQAIGPALMAPLARLLGLHVVVTHHGPDYDREKWGRLAKAVLHAGEAWGMRFSDGRIVISQTIRKLVRDKYGLNSDLIPNGITLPDVPSSTSALEKFGLTPGRYVLTVGRLVPEKRHLDLIQAFAAARLDEWKLVLVGTSEHPNAYTAEVTARAEATSGTVVAGFQHGIALQELYAHAGIFVLPSSHEGLPIALLEALSFGLPVVASDIPALLEIGLDDSHYFHLGDVSALAGRLASFASSPWPPELREKTRRWLAEREDWHSVAERTLGCYRRAIEPHQDVRRRTAPPHAA
ncbi:glycosyltransferase family 4 protein [Bradyrhizobium australafricanum]|uniref:glycosyltransferase family 4 protein n=1 Tax=Bradyrhizobium australafricanum TaxID=2821406 RepID=UPI001CE31D76|nr:glycosyltransferase family 4 protein [Bradyrhizobium australafricanum]